MAWWKARGIIVLEFAVVVLVLMSGIGHSVWRQFSAIGRRYLKVVVDEVIKENGLN